MTIHILVDLVEILEIYHVSGSQRGLGIMVVSGALARLGLKVYWGWMGAMGQEGQPSTDSRRNYEERKERPET